MADPVVPPDTDREATHPLLIISGTVIVVVLLSFVIYTVGGGSDQDVFAAGSAAGSGQNSGGACGYGQPDDSYSIAVTSDPDPPRPEGTTFRFTVRQGGRAVTGAKVCVVADMPTMEHPGLSGTFKEVPGGRYETVIKFGMGGAWKAGVTIVEPGKPVVTVTVPIEVAEVEQG